ncbi:MAG: carboxypeptidase regulatory-like domain-containing protein [Deltaproteobacteria bacterium]|nr:carboxypeptidase regulatory-like domain-containing protein [Deltaproteobacteria bacterium]
MFFSRIPIGVIPCVAIIIWLGACHSGGTGETSRFDGSIVREVVVDGKTRAREGHVAVDRSLEINRKGNAKDVGPIFLRRAISFFGVIHDRRGRGVPEAWVVLVPAQAGGAVAELRTDRDGAFYFSVLASGRYRVRVETPGYATLWRDVTLPRRSLEMVLRHVYTLRGRVSGDPGGGARCVVEVAGAGTAQRHRARCAPKGSFFVGGLPRGSYEVWARRSRPPWRASLPQVNIALPRPVRFGVDSAKVPPSPLTIALLPATRPQGRVVADETGAALTDVHVILRPVTPTSLMLKATTTKGGRFELPPVAAGRYRIEAWRSGYVPELGRSLRIPLGKKLTIRLRRGHTLEGRVVDGAGRGVKGAAVRVIAEAPSRPSRPHRGGGARRSPTRRVVGELGVTVGPVPPIPSVDGTYDSFAMGGPGSTTTDATGHFKVEGLRAGRVRALVTHSRYEQIRGPWVRLGLRRVASAKIVLRRAAVIAGRIRGAWGGMLGGVRVVARSRRGDRQVTSDDRGRFRILGLGGAIRVEIMALGYAPIARTLTLAPGQRVDLDLILGHGGEAIRGIVLDGGGKAVAGVKLRLQFGKTVIRSKSDRRGRFRWVVEAKGPYVLEVSAAGFVPYHRKLVRRPRGRLEVRLGAEGEIRGRVQDWRTGVALRRFSLRVVAASTGWREVVDRGGLFLIHAVPGRQTIAVRAQGYATTRVRVRVSDPRDGRSSRDVRVELREAGAISGIVRDGLGRPLAGARVEASGVRGRSDGRGRFRLDGVAAGSVIVTIRHGGHRRRSDPIVVRAGEVTDGLRLEIGP